MKDLKVENLKNKIENLKNVLVEKMKGKTFNELVELLNLQRDPEVRDSILTAMEVYHEEQFLAWL